MHEFTHSAHRFAIKSEDEVLEYKWLSEGLATTISHQYDKVKLNFSNTTLEEMINKFSDYNNYHTMFTYVLKNYGKDYILELIYDYDKLVKDTPKLFDEVNNFYNT